MDRSALTRLSRQRVAALLAVAVASATCVALYLLADIALLPASLWSGLVLSALILGLALFNGRKKLPFLPLLRASTWLQLHIYVGLLTVVVFLVHVRFQLPHGILDWVLAIVFSVVSLSGFVGLYLSRMLPRRMTDSGEALTFEKIPFHRKRIREAARALALQAEETCESSTIPDFYLQHVEPYLSEPAPLLLALAGRFRRRTQVVLRELEARTRYFSDAEKAYAAELREWVETKGNLDVQLSGQRLLRYWLFVHIPFTYVLILIGLVHAFMALRYGGAS